MENLTEQQRKQNLFDATWKTAQEMTHPAAIMTDDGKVKACMYLAPDGNKCFIGARIRPDTYLPEMDKDVDWGGTGVMSLFDDFPQVEKDFTNDGYSVDMDFLDSLQSIHDTHFEHRMERLERLAKRWDLTIPPDAV